MKSYKGILTFLFTAVLLTSLLSPWIAALWNLIIEPTAGWQASPYSFPRIFSRLFMILAVVLFFFCRSLLKIPSSSQLGLQPMAEGYKNLLRGFFVALASLVALGLIMSMSGIFTPYFRLSAAVALERSFKALLAALTVGFLEEIFFRGIIFKGLLEDWRPLGALLATNLFYSGIHFVKPTEKIAYSAGFDPWMGVRHLISSFQPFIEPTMLFPGIFGLFLIGLVLSYAFLRTGSLYLSIGLHAGWVFGLKTIRVFGDYRREDLGWLFGSTDPKLVSGAAGWIIILAVGITIHWMTRNQQTRSL